MAANSQDWMVTFFYEQELRSYYMNGILNAALKPGVHNASMALFVEDPAATSDTDASSNTSGIFLYIKQGTTLIFSNSYKKVEGVYERDFENVGTYLIKCVALTDIVKPLATWSTSQGMSSAVKNLLGPNRSPIHYCAAYLRYNPEDATETLEPSFVFVRPNENYTKEISAKDSIYFRSPYVDNNNIENDPYKLPDGCKNYLGKGSTEMQYLSWLNLGAVIERPGVAAAYPQYSYYTDVSWNEMGTSSDSRAQNGSVSWIKDHVFSARGLQEYRQTLSKETFRKTSDIIVDPGCKGMYIDLGNAYDDDVVYSQSFNWETIHHIGGRTSSITPSYSFSLSASALQQLLQSYKEESSQEISPVKPLEAVLVDAVFLTSNKRQSHSSTSLKDIFTSNQDRATNNEATVVGARWISSPGQYNYHPAFDRESDERNFGGGVYDIYHKKYQYSKASLDNHYISPLDISEANFSRLLDIVANKNVWPIIVDQLRLTNTFNPQTTTSLIPICLAFRKFKTIDGVNWKAIDGFSSASEVHPANILSCFDIQNVATQLNHLAVKSNDVYSILPIIK